MWLSEDLIDLFPMLMPLQESMVEGGKFLLSHHNMREAVEGVVILGRQCARRGNHEEDGEGVAGRECFGFEPREDVSYNARSERRRSGWMHEKVASGWLEMEKGAKATELEINIETRTEKAMIVSVGWRCKALDELVSKGSIQHTEERGQDGSMEC